MSLSRLKSQGTERVDVVGAGEELTGRLGLIQTHHRAQTASGSCWIKQGASLGEALSEDREGSAEGGGRQAPEGGDVYILKAESHG